MARWTECPNPATPRHAAFRIGFRCRSLRPPQIPLASESAIVTARHSGRTSHPSHMASARSVDFGLGRKELIGVIPGTRPARAVQAREVLEGDRRLVSFWDHQPERESVIHRFR